jgi:hypothetical protein
MFLFLVCKSLTAEADALVVVMDRLLETNAGVESAIKAGSFLDPEKARNLCFVRNGERANNIQMSDLYQPLTEKQNLVLQKV